MNLKLFSFAFLTALLISCNSTETLIDKQIENSLRLKIMHKNDSLMAAMATSDYKALKKLGSPDFVKFMHAKLRKDNVIWAFRKGYLQTQVYTILHEYHNRHNNAVGNASIFNEEENYTLQYTHKQKETYVSLLKCTFNDVEDYIVAIRYGLIDGQWKVNDIDLGFYGIYDKNAHDFYTLAQKAEEKNYTIDAFIYYKAANDLKEPLPKILKYEDTDEYEFGMKSMSLKLDREYKLPLIFDKILTKPEVIAIEPVKNKHGLYPMVAYNSIIPINDTASLKKEYELVKAEVRKVYKGLNFERDFMYYRAYNEETGDNYTFEDMAKK